MHGINNSLMLAHAQVIVAAPVYDVFNSKPTVPNSIGEFAFLTDDVIEYSVFARIFKILK
jgi:hypothetical protein